MARRKHYLQSYERFPKGHRAGTDDRHFDAGRLSQGRGYNRTENGCPSLLFAGTSFRFLHPIGHEENRFGNDPCVHTPSTPEGPPSEREPKLALLVL